VASKGVIVVTGTRTGSGRVAARRRPPATTTGAQPAAPAAAQAFAGRELFLSAEDLAPIKARILLMLALTVTENPAEIQRMFMQY
jgi:L-asparaginase/Glu-tRNA(Gln) amidotransferase subunit D